MWITFGQIDNFENCSNDVKRTIRRYSFIHSVEIFSLPLYGGPVLITRHAVILNKKHGWEV